jgi:hypothetical protein
LAILIARAKQEGQVGGLIPHLVDGGVSILQYDNDTIFFLEHDAEKAINMKLILSLFEQLSVLKINFHRSEIFCFGEAKQKEHEYREIFGCEAGSIPIRYWVSLYTIGNLIILNGIPWRVVLVRSLVVGATNYSLMVIVYYS